MSSPPFVVAIFIFSRICFVTLTVFILLCLGSFIVVVAVVIPPHSPRTNLSNKIYTLHANLKFFFFFPLLLFSTSSLTLCKNGQKQH